MCTNYYIKVTKQSCSELKDKHMCGLAPTIVHNGETISELKYRDMRH